MKQKRGSRYSRICKRLGRVPACGVIAVPSAGGAVPESCGQGLPNEGQSLLQTLISGWEDKLTVYTL